MDQSLVHTFSWGKFVWTNGPESSSKVSPTLALVHGWRFPATFSLERLTFSYALNKRTFSFQQAWNPALKPQSRLRISITTLKIPKSKGPLLSGSLEM